MFWQGGSLFLITPQSRDVFPQNLSQFLCKIRQCIRTAKWFWLFTHISAQIGWFGGMDFPCEVWRMHTQGKNSYTPYNTTRVLNVYRSSTLLHRIVSLALPKLMLFLTHSPLQAANQRQPDCLRNQWTSRGQQEGNIFPAKSKGRFSLQWKDRRLIYKVENFCSLLPRKWYLDPLSAMWR